MSYRFATPSQVFFNLAGTAPIPGGAWSFFELGTTTPKATYSDIDLTTPNSNPVLLDSSARLNTEVWLDGDYTAELQDADDVVIWNGDITSGNPAGLEIPTLAPGFLTNDGSNLSWQDIELFPDPTGSPGYMVIVNGAGDGYTLQAQPTPPEIPEPEVVVTTTSLRVGTSDDETKGLLQCGSGSASASGTKSTSAAIVYATPFATTPTVVVTPTGGPFATGNGAGGYYVDTSVTSQSTTGFTVTFNSNHGEENSDGNISSAVTFNYMAYGTVEVPA